MAKFMDVHSGMKGITQEALEQEHAKDVAAEKNENGVHFLSAWADPESGTVFCLSEGPDEESVRRVHKNAGHPADKIYQVPVSVE